MPIRRNEPGGLCLVSGEYRAPNGTPADGDIVFVPSRAGVSPAGSVISDAPVSVVADQTTGRWKVGLAPSSVVGPYAVQMGSFVARIVVPDEPSADFAEIIEVRK